MQDLMWCWSFPKFSLLFNWPTVLETAMFGNMVMSWSFHKFSPYWASLSQEKNEQSQTSSAGFSQIFSTFLIIETRSYFHVEFEPLESLHFSFLDSDIAGVEPATLFASMRLCIRAIASSIPTVTHTNSYGSACVTQIKCCFLLRPSR